MTVPPKDPSWTPETACSPGCIGWFVDDRNAIVRCDECRRFDDDDEAARHVLLHEPSGRLLSLLATPDDTDDA